MKLLFIMFVTSIISCVETVSYAARLSGARTRRVGASTSLFNILVVVSRFAVMIQAILIASIVDQVITGNRKILDPLIREQNIDAMVYDFRLVLISMSVGILAGILLTPSVARILAIGTLKLDKHGSVPRIVFNEGLFRTLGKLPSQIWLPSFRSNWQEIRAAKMPYTFLLLNAAIFAFYSIASLSSLYAGTLVPDHVLKANQMAAVINGVGTVLLVIFVDPVSAKLLDDVVLEKRRIHDLKAAVFQLGVGRLLGTVIGQVLLWPFGIMIKEFVLIFDRLFS
ncbi:lipid II flippase family protein [Brevibacillus sp. SYSU BS000544]|uniref:lipid II flippase family protein n=1 Tax=Brevibacillus sp. SYSU BS000544 TaxID=3416443 RepID=UPI003CE4B69A